jgi:S-layer homology domain
MNQNNQKSRLKRTPIDRITAYLLVSIFTGVTTIATNRAFAAPITPSSGRSIDLTTPATPANNQIAQASDIAGNWAEPFIKVLVEKGIIKGYPDGTFKPDRAVSRAEFAALLNRAFDLKPVRAERKFKDVANTYWANAVIQKAYRSGFIAGYPNGTFSPNQNTLRIQSLVALINGSKLEPTGNLDINSVFGDAAQVPSYGQNALVAATQRCIAVSQEYDSSKLPGGNFGPETVATRADVAAYIHQVLVGAGKLTALDKSSPANKYIAACPQGVYVTRISDTTPRTSTTSADEAIARLSVPQIPEIVSNNIAAYPVGGLNTPNAFGASWGGAFVGLVINQLVVQRSSTIHLV